MGTAMDLSTVAFPVNTPKFWGNEQELVSKCIETGWISSEGPAVKEFETKLAARCQRKHGVAVANGTAALDIAVKALGLSTGDEVILPSFCIISCINQAGPSAEPAQRLVFMLGHENRTDPPPPHTLWLLRPRN
ncbi:unnamed protein product [Effrenium voratum]|nr:unnamed protein product [Effrenium voratum]